MAEAHNPTVPLSLSFLLVTCISGFLFLTEATNHGFSVELIHRDSAKSPLYTESSQVQKLHSSFLHSIKRANCFYPNTETDEAEEDLPESEVIPITGEFIMAYSLGTPPFKIFGIADTGSDLVWSQCLPCRNCYNQIAPSFDRSKSSTFKNISCFDQKCTSIVPREVQTCCEDGTKLCQYDVQYADHLVSIGNITSGTLTLGSTSGRQVAFPNIVVGCGYIDGPFSETTSGIVGLGGGSISLVSQISSSIDGKFSYCLAPLSSNRTTKLNFGANGVVSGAGTVFTPMFWKDPAAFYYFTLEAINVGDKRIAFTSSGDSILSHQSLIYVC
ncbi:aspartic proteinase CDR1-like [Neltuma alba]|uniref:aspartic proteinase CDR1-like n=1 Tax=Neltuma alba TaxID=207710 RepID=UPI0010A2AA53|nr:aspartic proteinase CDR1-like [Prosopis alba]